MELAKGNKMAPYGKVYDEIVKTEEASLSKKPLEWLAIADSVFTESMQRLSAAMIQECDESETAAIHDWTKRVTESIKAFQDNARERFMTFALSKGVQVTENGTLEVKLDNGMVKRAIPTNTKPADRLVQRLLRAKGLSLDEYMFKEVSYITDNVKLKKLLDDEMITKSEYESCFDKLAYRVSKSQPINVGEDD